MVRNYKFTASDGKIVYVVARSRKAAGIKYAAMLEAAAIAAKQIKSLKVCKD